MSAIENLPRTPRSSCWPRSTGDDTWFEPPYGPSRPRGIDSTTTPAACRPDLQDEFRAAAFTALVDARDRGLRNAHGAVDAVRDVDAGAGPTVDQSRIADLGLSVPDFPNLFILYGPNVQRGTATAWVRREAHGRYVESVDTAHEQMIWTHPGREVSARGARLDGDRLAEAGQVLPVGGVQVRGDDPATAGERHRS
jgi:hypothetical protein